MNRSWKIAKLFDIDVYLHWTFLLLPTWVLLGNLSAGSGLATAVVSVVFLLAVFGCVLLHELGHALAARRYGIATRDITLLPIGGVARLEGMPRRPRHELVVALAGPLVNVVIASAIFVALMAGGLTPSVASFTAGMFGGPFLVTLMWTNVALVVFNLIPAFPMDGGRVLRALLAMNFSYEKATTIAARTGQGVAVCLGTIGFFSNWMLMFVALFVFMAAAGELKYVGMNESLRGYLARDAMQDNFRVLSADARLPDVVAELYFTQQDEFPVKSGPYLVGMLSRQQIMEAARSGGETTAARLMRPVTKTIDQDDTLPTTMAELNSGQHACLPVTSAGQLVGIVSLENVMRWLQEKTAPSVAG